MARHVHDAYDLTAAEKRDLIKLIEQGKPLPEKYRFLLFADKGEVELVWNGKSRDVYDTPLPFQTLEHIDESRKETGSAGILPAGSGFQPELLDTSGRQIKGWTNKLIWGDNKLILASLKSGALRRQIEGRKWIATDLGKFGIHTTRKRLIQVQRELKAGGQPFRAFEVLNLGRYERQAYLNVAGRLTGKKKEQALARKEQEFRDLILKAYRAEPLSGPGRTGGDAFFHGKNGGRLVVVGPINLPVGRLFIEEVVTECRKRGATRVDVLAFEFEMGLFPASLEEAKQKGIDLAPKVIPPEVFDRRAVEKGQVRFHEIAYIEVTPRFDKKDKLTLSVELTDFSVYYSQGLADAIAADLKEGKSEVICEQGKLIKVSKDKDGVISRDDLTKEWTDWVDYWAVDFDYESRKEIIKVAKQLGVEGALPGVVSAGEEFIDFEERWTGAYIFENEWQSFRTRQSRGLDLTSAPHTYHKPGRYICAVKVIDIFGNDTMTLAPVNVG